MHKPVHPHSQTPGRTSDGEETPATEPPTGPFSASAENGYRPASRVSVPNPYTTRGLDVDDVDTGANPVGQWRGVGLDEPEPRSPHTPATTDTMTDTPSSPEHTERPEAPVSHPAQPAPTADRGPSAGRYAANEAQRAEPRWPAPEPASPSPAPALSEPAPQQWTPPQGAHTQQGHQDHQGQHGYQGHYQGPPGYSTQPVPQGPPVPPDPRGHQGSPGYQAPPAPGSPPPHGYRQYGGYPQPGPHPEQHHPAPHQAAPQHPGQYPQAEYPPQQYAPQPYPQQPPPHPQQPPPYAPPPAPNYPAPYPQPQPLVTYQNAYPAPYQPPGYVLPGQPVVHPQQFNPYGQPVQHVIVLAPGQPPQVVTAESAATLFAERTEPAASEEARQNKALTRSEPATGEPGAGEETAGAGTEDTAEDTAEDAQIPATGTARTESTAQKASEDGSAAGTVGTTGAEPSSTAPHDPEKDILNEALAGLAMRDLSLVDALLEMVEELETGAQDPDLLDKLFQIDNFATRMRRNGENFLVLTGHEGGESDAHDEIVPLLDVARAATSEIKDYPRVSLGKLPQTSITGLAADDISHLLAELLDNATANSPEHSQVVISAQELDDGRLMIVVEDEGVGIPDAQLADLNGRLGGGPVLDDEVPRHMGLYVASRIARKHGLETRLEPRSFRGLSAYTIVPRGLMRVATPRQPGQSRTSTTPGASAPVTPTESIPPQPANGKGTNGSGGPKPSPGGTSAVTSAGLPRRSATPHGSPLRMMPHPGALSENPPSPPEGREDTPPKLTGEARAEQIRDEIGDFLDGERAALEGEDIEGEER